MPLLQEKLKAPPLPLSVVARPRLNDFFALNERIRLLVVQAPSGYGKTTLLAERLPALEQEAAWLRLDQRDNQPERFLSYWQAAIQSLLGDHTPLSPLAEGAECDEQECVEQLERWLGRDKGWGIAVLSFGEKSVEKYIKLHMGPCDDYNSKFEAYLESYHRQGIVSIDFANVFILREDTEHPNWKLNKRTYWPNKSLTRQMSDWLQSQSTYLNPDWQPDPGWKPKLSTYYKTLWRDWDHTKGMLEADDSNWLPGDPLNKDEAELMSLMRGDTTVKEIREAWEGSEIEFMEAFRGLGLRFALV